MLSEAKIYPLGITIDVYQKPDNVWVASGIFNGSHIVVEQPSQGTAVKAWRDQALAISQSKN